MVGDSLMEEVRSDLDLEKLGSTRSDRKEVGRLPPGRGLADTSHSHRMGGDQDGGMGPEGSEWKY